LRVLEGGGVTYLEFFHKTVLLKETLLALNLKQGGVYFDGTVGGAGLACKIAESIGKEGKLIALDIDPDAVRTSRKRLSKFGNSEVFEANFTEMSNVCGQVLGKFLGCVDGVVLDLGVSSYQIDNAERGFSYTKDSKLDMRMSQYGKSAWDLVNILGKFELANIIRVLGEEPFANAIAKAICRERVSGGIDSTIRLVNIIERVVGYRGGGHPAKKTFQALRIAVNRELENLNKALDEAIELLKPAGRIAVISFHSLEDRIVKQKIRQWNIPCTCPQNFPICVCKKKSKAITITKKPITPSWEEIIENPRSRSAKLRVCEKI
jgi:16S rRNA (cytosine1402-N4)-methyltransferase